MTPWPKELPQRVPAQLVALLPVPPGPAAPKAHSPGRSHRPELPSGHFWG